METSFLEPCKFQNGSGSEKLWNRLGCQELKTQRYVICGLFTYWWKKEGFDWKWKEQRLEESSELTHNS